MTSKGLMFSVVYDLTLSVPVPLSPMWIDISIWGRQLVFFGYLFINFTPGREERKVKEMVK